PEMRRSVQDRIGVPAADHKISGRHLAIHQARWREDRLWLAWRYHSVDYLGRVGAGDWVETCSHIAPVSLPDLRSDPTPADLPAAVELGLGSPLPAPALLFEVMDGSVYVSAADAVYRLRGKAADKLPVSVKGHARLQAVNGRLVICAADTILAYDPQRDRVETLASARRRPATNLLDARNGLGLPVPAPSGCLRVAVAGEVFEYEFVLRAWRALPNFKLPMFADEVRVHDDAVEFHTPPHRPVGLACRLPANSTNWFFTALRLPPTPMIGFMTSIGPSLPGLPEWMPADPDLSPAVIATASGSNLVWAIMGLQFDVVGNHEYASLRSTNGCHTRLAAFRRGVTQPAVIPLWLDLPTNTLHRTGFGGLSAGGLAPGEQLVSTPHGLVYLVPGVPGFWLVPWNDLLPRVEAELARLAAVQDLPAPPPRGSDRTALWLRKYDGNGDGKLDYREFHLFALGERMVGEGANSHGWMSVPTVFKMADKNQDGGLDAAELVTLKGVPGARPAGQTTVPGSLLLKYDKNKNGRLDPEEMEAFIADRKKAGQPLPGESAPKPKPQP
ncbi:MAG: hypothetical protein EBS05_10600, partial [Proteobacteria bacterium]|nr:hypothetical protein [Pseudomonadota bacterium]